MARGNYPSETMDAYSVRMPGDLRHRIKKAAAENGQSMNSAIVFVLDRAFPKPIEPESLNEALKDAAQEVLTDWSAVVKATGQDPEQNAALARLKALLEKAEGE